MPLDCRVAAKIWKMSGQKLDWEALPYLLELYGVNDTEIMLAQLVTIRDYKWPSAVRSK